MVIKEVVIKNKTGIHARPAYIFCQEASKFKSDITIYKDGEKGNGKSIVNILALALNQGSNISISAEGEDELQAVEALVELVESKFGEA
jgi:phosphotransferase system HPr (HPr) family protein